VIDKSLLPGNLGEAERPEKSDKTMIARGFKRERGLQGGERSWKEVALKKEVEGVRGKVI